jgi:hypothetical protein
MAARGDGADGRTPPRLEGKGMTLVEIDQEFHALCPPLQPEEREQLEASLRAEGCRDALIVWQAAERAWCANCDEDVDITYRFDHHPYRQEGDDREGFWLCDKCYTPINEEDLTPILLDGHNRYALCQMHELPFPISYQWQLNSREEAINWIIATQLGRRNLTPEQKSYLRGKRFNLEKRQDGGHGDQKSEDKKYPPIRERLAKEYQVSTTTIKNDAQFASAVDTLEAQVRQDIRETVLRRQDREQGKITKQQAMHTGKLVQDAKVLPQPFMRREHWKPYHLLEAIDLLADLPQAEHAAVNRLLDGPFIPADDGLAILKNLAAMPEEKRQSIYTLHSHPEKREHDLALALAAEKAPPPDPQSQLAGALLVALHQVQQRLRRNWINVYPHEAWSDDLRDLEATLLQMMNRLTAIEAQVDTVHHERMARYGTTV